MAKKQKVSVVGTVLTVEYPSIGKKFVFDYSKAPREMRVEAERHGWKQKFGDAKSGESAAEKFAMVQRIHAGILENQWELTGTPDLTPIICEAIARIKKVPLVRVTNAATVAGPEQVKKWGAELKVKAEILKIRAEKAAKAAEEDEDELDIEIK